jgi:hypothetical protein
MLRAADRFHGVDAAREFSLPTTSKTNDKIEGLSYTASERPGIR